LGTAEFPPPPVLCFTLHCGQIREWRTSVAGLSLSVESFCTGEVCQAQSDSHERPILRQISAFAYRMLSRPPPNARFANETLAVNTCALVVRRRLSSTKFQLLSMVSQNTGLLRFDGVRFVEWKTAGNDCLLQLLLRGLGSKGACLHDSSP